MEAQEAGIEPWPQLPFRPRNFSVSDSGAGSTQTYANDPQQRDPTPPTTKDPKEIRAEGKRQRKAERDAIRAAKALRRARREAIASAKSSHGAVSQSQVDGAGVGATPSLSTQESEPISSFPDVSSSMPVESDEVDELDEDEKEESRLQASGSGGSPTQSPSAPKDSLPTSLEDSGITSPGDSSGTPSPKTYSKGKTSIEVNVKKPTYAFKSPVANGKVKPIQKTQDAPTPKSKETNATTVGADHTPRAKATPIKRKRPVNADAGPSTLAQPAKCNAKPKSKNGPDAGPEIDEALRSRLSDVGASQEFIASKWFSPPYLNALEAAGIVVLRKGKLSDEERTAVRRHFEIFMKSNRLDEEQLVEVIMSKAKGAREAYPSFWQDVAAQIPGRPLRYVLKQVQRMYDTRGRKGAWTADEDRELRRSHAVHPGEWTKIAAIVDRTEQDCRDRWNKELANSETRHTGPWTTAEEDMLQEVIAEANESMGDDPFSPDAPWDVVSAKMKHQRSSTQCRIKWRRELYPRLSGTGARLSMTPSSSQATRTTQRERKRKSPPAEPTKASEGKHKRGRKSVSVVLKTKRLGMQYKSEDMIEDSGSDQDELDPEVEDEKEDEKEVDEMEEIGNDGEEEGESEKEEQDDNDGSESS